MYPSHNSLILLPSIHPTIPTTLICPFNHPSFYFINHSTITHPFISSTIQPSSILLFHQSFNHHTFILSANHFYSHLSYIISTKIPLNPPTTHQQPSTPRIITGSEDEMMKIFLLSIQFPQQHQHRLIAPIKLSSSHNSKFIISNPTKLPIVPISRIIRIL